jgi:hypothetical protein
MTPDDVFRLEQYDPLEYLPPGDAAAAIRAAVKAEREACAEVVEATILLVKIFQTSDGPTITEHLAALRDHIRARGE